jgi:hemerythrin-like domain-containing protein
MKYASEELKNEHEAILRALTILETMISALRSRKTSALGDLAAMTDFLKLFADTCHHGKEEGILFPAMERYGIPREGGPIGQMLAEHEQGRTFIRAMSAAVSAGNSGSAAFCENAEGYISLLRAHIRKENEVLFPMGDQVIPAWEQKEILEAFERHEAAVMGPGIHEKLHAQLDDFASVYLK